MRPQVGIGIDGSVHNTRTQTDEHQQQQRGKQKRINQGATDGRTHDLQRIEEKCHLHQKRHKGVLRLEESAIGRSSTQPGTEDECQSKKGRHPAEECLNGT